VTRLKTPPDRAGSNILAGQAFQPDIPDVRLESLTHERPCCRGSLKRITVGEFVDPGLEKRFSAFVNRVAAAGSRNLENVPEMRVRTWFEGVQTSSTHGRVPKNGTELEGDLS
jgi:hypothetical protein